MFPELSAGRQYWALSGYDIQQGYPRDIANYGFPSSVRAIDAAVSYRGKTYFFINNQCWRWDDGVFPLRLTPVFLCPVCKPSTWTSGDVLIYMVLDRLSEDVVLTWTFHFYHIKMPTQMYWGFCIMKSSHPRKAVGWDIQKEEGWFLLWVEFWCSQMNVFHLTGRIWCTRGRY